MPFHEVQLQRLRTRLRPEYADQCGAVLITDIHLRQIVMPDCETLGDWKILTTGQFDHIAKGFKRFRCQMFGPKRNGHVLCPILPVRIQYLGLKLFKRSAHINVTTARRNDRAAR